MTKKTDKPGRIIGVALRYFVASVSLSIVLYIIFALLFSTREEKLLQEENRLYETMYSELREREALISDVVDGLLVKDNGIYRQLFEADSPALLPATTEDIIADSDSLSDSFYLSKSAVKSENLMHMAGRVDENFRAIFDQLVDRDTIPPLSLPTVGMSFVQTGASVGPRHNPVYKVEMQHEGIDLIIPQGEAVFAAGSGVVSEISRSRRGLGHVVEIDHRNGYVSRYALLGEVSLQEGQKVKLGQKVGYVGESGMFAPHLHYEVLYKGEVQDPVNYFFASVSPEDYSRMLYLSASTLQSMD